MEATLLLTMCEVDNNKRATATRYMPSIMVCYLAIACQWLHRTTWSDEPRGTRAWFRGRVVKQASHGFGILVAAWNCTMLVSVEADEREYYAGVWFSLKETTLP
jgi:hypothetical protein